MTLALSILVAGCLGGLLVLSVVVERLRKELDRLDRDQLEDYCEHTNDIASLRRCLVRQGINVTEDTNPERTNHAD